MSAQHRTAISIAGRQAQQLPSADANSLQPPASHMFHFMTN